MTEARDHSIPGERSPDRPKLPGFGAFALLLGLTAIVLLPGAFDARLLNFDDDYHYGSLSPLHAGGILHALDPTERVANAYLPVTHLSIWLDLQLFDGPVGWHLHSLLLHAIAALLLARLAVRLGVPRGAALAASAVFLVHPALVECAAWLSSRKDLLAGIFTLLALGAVTAGARGTRTPRGAAASAAVFGLLAVYSKGSALVLPLLAAAVVWIVAPRPRRAVPAVLGLLVVAVLAGIHHTIVAVDEGTIVAGGSAIDRLVRVPGVFLHYVTTALWPASLNVLYPEVATFERFATRFAPGLAVALAWIAAVVLLRRRAPLVALGLAWFALALLPYNTAFPQSSLAAADRYLYLAIPGIALALGSVRRPPGAILCAAAAVPLAFAAHDRAADFESSEALWNASLSADPENALALFNLGQALGSRGAASADVEALFERASEVARYPQHRFHAESALARRAEVAGRLQAAHRHAARAAEALEELGDGPAARDALLRAHVQAARLARRAGDETAAAAHDARIAAIAPDHPLALAARAARLLGEATNGQGRAAADDPRVAEARRLCERALASAPAAYEAHWVLGELGRATGALLSAEKHLRDAIAIDPLRPEAHLARVDLFLGQEGMAETAELAIREALAIGVVEPGLRFRLALALGQQGRLDDARRHYEAYLALQPGDRAARLGLAQVIAAIGMQKLWQLPPEQLEAMAERVLELDPDNAKARRMLAVAARGRHDMLAALVLLERLHEETPDDAEIRQLYAETLRDRGWQLKLKEGRDDAAFDTFVRFLEVAPPGVPTDAVRNALEIEWRRQLEIARAALLAQDLDAAEQSLRRCLELRPDDKSPHLQLGMALLMRGPEHAEAALEHFETAREGQQRRGGDASLPVLYEIRALRLLDRDGEALRRGEAFLADPGPAAPEILERIRAAIEP